MRRYLGLLALLPLLALAPMPGKLVSASPRKATSLVIEGDTITVVRKLPFMVKAKEGAHLYDWYTPDTVKAFGEDHKLTVISCPKGSFTIRCRATTITYDEKEKKVKIDKEFHEVEVNYGGVTPTPGPGPEPEPEPQPDDKAPIPLEGFRVLIVYETADQTKLPNAQNLILYSSKVRSYLNSKCVQEGKVKGWWILDKDVDTSAMPKHWQDAMKRPRKSVPWILISTGKTGYEGPLPANVDETLKLLKKYGGE